MATATKVLAPGWRLAFQKWCYKRSYFPEIGLMRDDCLEETPAVKEALRRIPAEIVDQRNFRIMRAFSLSAKKTVLPKEEWTKFEEDVQYLKPIVAQVEAEMLEKAEWNSR